MLVYRIFKSLIWLYAGLRERVSPGWMQKNSSRIREWELMAYAYSSNLRGIHKRIRILSETLTF
ncbi:MAG: hypothetical protein QXQ73_05850 [Desulfurococcaceae archaeon]